MTEQEKKMWQEDLDMIAKLNKEVDELHNRIDKAIKYIEENIHFCENDSQGAYDVCNIRIASDKKLLEILKGKE